MKIGFVGCGDIAGYTALFCRLNRRIKIQACCDTNLKRAEAFADKNRISRTTTDFSELLSQDLDAVYLAVPHYLHAEMMLAAIEKGLHIFCEKPITTNVNDAQKVIEKAKSNDIKIGINYQYRYDTACYALARALQKKQFGQVYYARCHIPWFREDSYFDESQWHRSIAQAGGGTLITQGSHFLDILLWGFQEKISSIQAVTKHSRFTNVEVEDLALANLELENGTMIQLCSSMVSNPEQPARIEVYGEKGTMAYTAAFFPKLKSTFKFKKEIPPIRGFHALQRSIEGFRSWVMEGKPYLIPASEAVPVLEAVEKIYQEANKQPE